MKRSLYLWWIGATAIAATSSLIASTYGLARFGFGLFLPEFDEEFDIPDAASGAIFGGAFVSYCLAAAVAIRYPSRAAMLVVLAGASAAIGSLGVATASSAAALAVGVVLAGAGAGFASPGVVAILDRTLTPRRASLGQSIANAGMGPGLVIAGVLALVFAESWRAAWYVIAAVVVLTTAATLLVQYRRHPVRSDSQGTTGGRSAGASWRSAQVPIVAAVVLGCGSAAVWTFGRATIERLPEVGAAESVLSWIALGVGAIAGSVAGPAVGRFGIRASWSTAAIGMALATASIPLAGNAVIAIVCCVIFGAAYTALSGVLIEWARVTGLASAGTAALFIALAAGQALGAPLLGILLETMSAGIVFALAGALSIASIAVVARFQN